MWALLPGSSSGMAFESTLAPVGARSIIAALSRRRRWVASDRFRHPGRPANTDFRRCRNGWANDRIMSRIS